VSRTQAAVILIVCSAVAASPATVGPSRAQAQAARAICPSNASQLPELPEHETSPLVPRKGLVSVALCRYAGEPHLRGGSLASGALIAQARGDRLVARSVAEEIDHLQVLKTPATGCPEDNGAIIYLRFRFSDRRHRSVVQRLSGCTAVYGTKHAPFFFTSGKLFRRLRKIVPAPVDVALKSDRRGHVAKPLLHLLNVRPSAKSSDAQEP
jgi:hypothetical protein